MAANWFRMLGLRGVMVKNKYVSRRVILTMELAETHYISIHTSKYWHLIGGRGGWVVLSWLTVTIWRDL